MDTRYFSYIIGVSKELLDGIHIIWIALRADLPRPLDPQKFWHFCQGVKSRYVTELTWMKKDMSPTLHKVEDHAQLVLGSLPETIRIWMLSEEALEGQYSCNKITTTRI